MTHILAGTLLISILHALIPSHWLPLVTLAKMQKWTERETIRTSFYLGASHVLSTVLLGLLLGGIVAGFHSVYKGIQILGPSVLVVSGIFFIYRHHTHHHFHIDDDMMNHTKTRKQVIYALMAFMFLSPCLEIEAFFINASLVSWWFLTVCILVYIFVSLIGTVLWTKIAYRGIQRINSHRWDHNAGIITGIIMILSGIISFLLES